MSSRPLACRSWLRAYPLYHAPHTGPPCFCNFAIRTIAPQIFGFLHFADFVQDNTATTFHHVRNSLSTHKLRNTKRFGTLGCRPPTTSVCTVNRPARVLVFVVYILLSTVHIFLSTVPSYINYCI